MLCCHHCVLFILLFIKFTTRLLCFQLDNRPSDRTGQTETIQPPYERHRKVNWTVIQRQRYYSLQISPRHKREGDERKTDRTREKLSSTKSANTIWRRTLHLDNWKTKSKEELAYSGEMTNHLEHWSCGSKDGTITQSQKEVRMHHCSLSVPRTVD